MALEALQNPIKCAKKAEIVDPWKAFYSDAAGWILPSRPNGVRPDAVGECQAMMVRDFQARE
jgi:hypothetical protein